MDNLVTLVFVEEDKNAGHDGDYAEQDKRVEDGVSDFGAGFRAFLVEWGVDPSNKLKC